MTGSQKYAIYGKRCIKKGQSGAEGAKIRGNNCNGKAGKGVKGFNGHGKIRCRAVNVPRGYGSFRWVRGGRRR